MDSGDLSLAIDLGREALWVAVKLSFPILLSALVVGALISVLQAATQIQDQTLNQVPKLFTVAWELEVWLLVGFAAALLFAGVQLGGHLIDQELGILQANLLDPMLNEQISIVGQFKVLLATLVYLLINGHHLLIAALSDSFRS